jgi:CRP-like cAMP-binding protein
MEPAILTVETGLTAETGPASVLSRKISASSVLSPSELATLRSFEANPRPLRRRQEFITEGRKYQNLFVILEGVSIRYRVLRNGTRQVIGIMLPGDIAGVPGCLFESALYSVRTLTDSVVSPVPLNRIIELFDIQPRLAAKIFWSFTCDAAVFAERLIAVGRLSALERVAHLVLELLTRMQAIGLADERSFAIPLTQELIGDALGLSVPHVNRVLRQLRDDDILKIKEGIVIVNDVDALEELADFEQTYLKPLSISELF